MSSIPMPRALLVVGVDARQLPAFDKQVEELELELEDAQDARLIERRLDAWLRGNGAPLLRAFLVEGLTHPREPWRVVVGALVAARENALSSEPSETPLAEVEHALAEARAGLRALGAAPDVEPDLVLAFEWEM